MLIAFSGKKQSGKSTIAQLTKKHLRGKTVEVNFADPLKEEVAKACMSSVEFVEKNKTLFRPMLQWWGTDYRRRLYGDDYWTKKWLEKVDKLGSDVYNVLVADVRFENEAECIRELDGFLVRVNRPTVSEDQHASETSLDGYEFDFVIDNNGTIEELEKQVIEMLKNCK